MIVLLLFRWAETLAAVHRRGGDSKVALCRRPVGHVAGAQIFMRLLYGISPLMGSRRGRARSVADDHGVDKLVVGRNLERLLQLLKHRVGHGVHSFTAQVALADSRKPRLRIDV